MDCEECRQQTERPSVLPKQLVNIKNCCFLLPLELGCKVIAVFEGFCGLCESILAFKQLSRTKDRWNMPQWKTTSAVQQRNPEVSLFIGLVTLFSAQLLLAGVAYKRMTCVLIWLYVVLITTVFFVFYTLVYACIPDTMIYDIISAALEAYFMLIVLSYYLQQQRAFGADDEFEVLFTASEAQLTANP